MILSSLRCEAEIAQLQMHIVAAEEHHVLGLSHCPLRKIVAAYLYIAMDEVLLVNVRNGGNELLEPGLHFDKSASFWLLIVL